MLHITPWERLALECLASDMTTAQVAGLLGVPDCDIEAKLAALFSRLGASSRTDAVAVASRRGLIPAAPVPGASQP